MKKKTDLTPLKQGQQNKLNDLPEEMLSTISSYLNKNDQSALVSSGRTIYGFLQPSRKLAALLRSVVTGNQDRVIQILSRYPQLMVIQGLVTDNSDRTFLKASAAELVRWCGDLRYMANAMLNILKSFPDQPLAEEIRAKWVALDNAYDLSGGLEFVLPGGTRPERPSLAFSLTPLLNALQVYINTFMTMTWEQREAQWCTKVGAEQRLLTAYYLQNYCNPNVPFHPTPSFDAPTFPRSLEIDNINTHGMQGVWARVDNGGVLGRDFGIARGSEYAGRGTRPAPDRGSLCAAPCDLVALRACEERTARDLLAFKQKLRKPLNQQPVAEQKSSHSCSIS